MSDSDKLRYCIIYATFAIQFYIHYIIYNVISQIWKKKQNAT